MTHHEKLAKRQTFWEFYKCSCRSAAHLEKTLLFSRWHHFFKKNPACYLYEDHLLPFSAEGSSVSESGKVASIGWAEIQATPCFFLFSVVWFTDLFLHMGSIPHLIAYFQAVLCFQQYDSFPLNGPLGVSIRWSHICTGTLHMPQNAWHVKCFFFLPIVFLLLYVAK